MDGELFLQFSTGQEYKVRDKKVLLFDDVSTTGTTLEQSAYLLRQAGAREVVDFRLAVKVMESFEGESQETAKEGQEVDPLLAHLLV
jgi:hypoxanthine phosphoribosyltransferase